MDWDPFHLWTLSSDSGLLFYLRGPLSQELVVEITDNLVRKLRVDNEDTGTVLNVQAVIVELSQNIIRYSAEKVVEQDEDAGGAELGSGIITISCGEGGYVLASGNLIDDRDVPGLRARLDELLVLDADALRALFLERRRGPVDSERGAGLGLIAIARKARVPIQYQIHPVCAGKAFFSIRVVV